MDPTTVLLLSTTLLVLTTTASSAGIGINYGQIADNLPHPTSVLPLLQSINATRVKLYDADPTVLKAFANTGVQFVIGIGNEYLPTIRDPTQSLNWVKSNVRRYLPNTNITSIAVGNEILTLNDPVLTANLLPAMRSLYTALVSLNLHRQVSVTTAHNLGVLQVSYPPSAGIFRRELVPTVTKILDFHQKTGSPFLINPYPYFAYKSTVATSTNPKQLLDFALFNGGVIDPATGLHYNSMFEAQIDAAIAAVEKLGFRNVTLQVSETGWPSKGDADEPGATAENAGKYNAGVLKVMDSGKGTPMRPDSDLNVYIFALFNENQKPGPTSERNFGLFQPDGTAVYDLGFNVTGGLVSAANRTGGGGGGAPPPVESVVEGGGGASSHGYLSITSDAVVLVKLSSQGASWFLCLVVSLVLSYYRL